LGDPRPGDIVMLHYPRNPAMLLVKRVIAKEGDIVPSDDGTVYRWWPTWGVRSF
jgi:signal peptidase I